MSTTVNFATLALTRLLTLEMNVVKAEQTKRPRIQRPGNENDDE